MGRKKKTSVPANSFPALEQSGESSKTQVDSEEMKEQEKLNGTLIRQALNVMNPAVIQSKEAAKVFFGEEARKNWKTYTNKSKISNKGMGLEFVAPTILEEIPTYVTPTPS